MKSAFRVTELSPPWTCVCLLLWVTAACASSSSSLAPQPSPRSTATDPTHAIEVLGGLRSYRDLEPIEETFSPAVQYEVSWKDPDTGFRYGFELGISQAEDEDNLDDPGLGSIDVEGTWWEYYAGLRSTVTDVADWIRPYFAVGLSVVDTEFEASAGSVGADLSDTSWGAYVRGGVLFPVVEHVRLGLDYRYRFLDGIEFGQVSALIGYSF